jgi:hypothetical protein
MIGSGKDGKKLHIGLGCTLFKLVHLLDVWSSLTKGAYGSQWHHHCWYYCHWPGGAFDAASSVNKTSKRLGLIRSGATVPPYDAQQEFSKESSPVSDALTWANDSYFATDPKIRWMHVDVFKLCTCCINRTYGGASFSIRSSCTYSIFYIYLQHS